MTSDCCAFKFLRRSVNGKHLTGFQSENAVFKFLWRGVDEPFVNLELVRGKLCDRNNRALTQILLDPNLIFFPILLLL